MMWEDALSNKTGLVLVGGIISAAASGLPAATKLAVGGMAVLFVGGVLRVYSE